jgi:ribosome-associated translation inhibitor RaiA
MSGGPMSYDNARSKKKKAAVTHDTENHSGLIETDSEVKSYIYQQVADFNPYVTPETLIMVIARDPKELHVNSTDIEINHFDEGHNNEGLSHEELSKYKHRIAIVLEEDGTTLEAEAYHDDIYEAIKLAKTSLLERLMQWHDEVAQDAEKKNPKPTNPHNNGQLH